MNKIITFPSTNSKNKTSWKKSMLEVLDFIKEQTYVPEKLEEDILKIMMDVCMENQPTFEFSLEIPQAVSLKDRKVIESSFRYTLKDFNKSIAQFSQEALVKRLELEVRLYIHSNNR